MKKNKKHTVKGNFIIKLQQFIKASLFFALSILFYKLCGPALVAPGIGSKILAVVFFFLCGLSADVAFYYWGFYD